MVLAGSEVLVVPKSELSQKVHAPSSSGDPARDYVAEQRRHAFCEAIDIMEHRPELKINARDYLRGVLFAEKSKEESKLHGDVLDASCRTLAKMDEQFVDDYLVSYHGMNAEVVSLRFVFTRSLLEELSLYSFSPLRRETTERRSPSRTA